MKRFYYIVFFIFPLFLSCEREIRYAGDQAEPRLVLEAVPHAGSKTLVCYLSRSRFFLDSTKPDSASMAKASINLSTSSGACTIEIDSVVGLTHYLLLAEPLPAGDTLRLVATHPDFPTIEASEYIMPACMPSIKSLSRDTAGCNITMTLPEYPCKNGRIGLNGKLYATRKVYVPQKQDTLTYSFAQSVIESKDEIFAPLNSFYLLYEGYRAKADDGERLFFYSDYAKDTRVHIRFYIPNDRTNVSYHLDSVILSLEARSETYTTYFSALNKYMNQNRDGSGMSVEEPVSVYTNIANGYGVLASKTYSKIIIK